jgi:cobalt-zinc-cadmium resistance protein CzcA
MDFDENLEKNATDNQPSIKLFEQEVNSNKAQISLENQKITELIGGVYWQTFKTQTSFKI